jgi:kynurenine formamidase
VLDRTDEVAADAGYLLTMDDLEGFGREHGQIAPGTWLLFRTGWGASANDEEAFLNAGPDGPQTPGPDVDASRWGGFDPPFPAHNFVLGTGRCGLTQIANAHRLPTTGAILIVAPLKRAGGTGSTARVVAFVPN